MESCEFAGTFRRTRSFPSNRQLFGDFGGVSLKQATTAGGPAVVAGYVLLN